MAAEPTSSTPVPQIHLIDHTTTDSSSLLRSPSAQTPTPQPAAAASPSQSHPPPQPDAHIDILYENQRGWFLPLLGIPLFSSSALWNLRLDAPAWQDAHLHPSPVNITNAQVPDPSWRWDWKTWYVDMSRDVDEEGWEYSFWFKGGTSWHGRQTWWHSFVRRRRWLRKRVKVHVGRGDRKERLFGEQFSVGAGTGVGLGRSSTFGSGLRSRGEQRGSGSGAWNEQVVEEEEEVTSVNALMRVLKRSAIDREKLGAINKFIDEGGEQVAHLASQMPTIMSLLIFQASRHQLLSTLTDLYSASQESASDNPTDLAAQQRTQYLAAAVTAADAQVKKLEYWSDIRKLAESGAAGHAVDPEHGWDGSWEGLDRSGPRGPSKQNRVDEGNVGGEESWRARGSS